MSRRELRATLSISHFACGFRVRDGPLGEFRATRKKPRWAGAPRGRNLCSRPYSARFLLNYPHTTSMARRRPGSRDNSGCCGRRAGLVPINALRSSNSNEQKVAMSDLYPTVLPNRYSSNRSPVALRLPICPFPDDSENPHTPVRILPGAGEAKIMP